MWTYASGTTDVTMTIINLKIEEWVAIGFSLDNLMGQDHVFFCQYLANGTVAVKRAYNPGNHTRPIDILNSSAGGTFSSGQTKVENGEVTCQFTLSNFVTEPRAKRQVTSTILSQTLEYILLIAIGAFYSPNNMVTLIKFGQQSQSVSTMRRHDQRQPLSSSVTLNQRQEIVYNMNTSSQISTTPSPTST
ncbi:unnamed protein product, partial [Didymodactylos carnosus]